MGDPSVWCRACVLVVNQMILPHKTWSISCYYWRFLHSHAVRQHFSVSKIKSLAIDEPSARWGCSSMDSMGCWTLQHGRRRWAVYMSPLWFSILYDPAMIVVDTSTRPRGFATTVAWATILFLWMCCSCSAPSITGVPFCVFVTFRTHT